MIILYIPVTTRIAVISVMGLEPFIPGSFVEVSKSDIWLVLIIFRTTLNRIKIKNGTKAKVKLQRPKLVFTYKWLQFDYCKP